MTAVLAINFIYHILVISDCRVTWSGSSTKLQDNLQKVYPLGPTGVIGFAGNVSIAQEIIKYIQTMAPKKDLPLSVKDIVYDISEWAKMVYSNKKPNPTNYVELMYVAVDYGDVSLIAQNVSIAKNILVKMVSPFFKPIFNNDVVQLGYAIKYPLEHIIFNRDNLLNLGLEPKGRLFQAAIAVNSFGEELTKLGENTVGGMFSVGLCDLNGIHWVPYGNDRELKIEDGRFIQYDHVNNRRVPLKTIIEFNPNLPDVGNLFFKMPNT
jgi:hypothetical protein